VYPTTTAAAAGFGIVSGPANPPRGGSPAGKPGIHLVVNPSRLRGAVSRGVPIRPGRCKTFMHCAQVDSTPFSSSGANGANRSRSMARPSGPMGPASWLVVAPPGRIVGWSAGKDGFAASGFLFWRAILAAVASCEFARGLASTISRKTTGNRHCGVLWTVRG